MYEKIGTVASVPDQSNGHLEKEISELVMLASGWHAEIIAVVDQSFAGWHVEIGDADNDKLNEVLVTGAPNSQLRMFKKVRGTWGGRVLAENLAQQVPGMGLTVKVVDLNNDGRNELILGTGQEGGGEAFFYVLQTDGEKLTRKISCRTGYNQSAYTHNLAAWDLDGDGVKEVISAYCGSGEVFRYNMDKELTAIKRTKVFQCSGSGEDVYIGDVDGDGKVECVICSCYRENQAKVHIFDFDQKGELILPPRITLEGYGKHPCFNCSVAVGDFDNDGKTELIVIWKRTYEISMGTIIAYRVNGNMATTAYTIAEDDKDLDTGYGERLMHVADADNDGRNELIVSTRGEGAPANGNGLGHVLMFKWGEDGKIQKTLLAKSIPGMAESCWSAVGDADNDGRNEIVIATGKGDRTKPGFSYVWMMKKDIPPKSGVTHKMNTNKLCNLIRTPYKYNKPVVAASGLAGEFDSLYTDAPFLFRHNGKFCMTYIGFDGVGYQTGLAVSDDLIHWQRQGLLLGRGAHGSINEFNVAMTSILKDDELFGTGELKKVNGRYVGTYHAYPKSGYEEGPAIIGLCFSDDLKKWELSQAILRAEDGADWECGGLYKSYLIENLGIYYLFYNAKNKLCRWTEQIGVAISSDLINWRRHPGNPILTVGAKGGFDDFFASDPCVHKHGNNWIMFYFGNSSDGHARNSAAFSTDLLHWEKSGKILIDIGAPGTVDSRHAHKPGIIGVNGVLYHFYCAVTPNPDCECGQTRGISLAVSNKKVLQNT